MPKGLNTVKSLVPLHTHQFLPILYLLCFTDLNTYNPGNNYQNVEGDHYPELKDGNCQNFQRNLKDEKEKEKNKDFDSENPNLCQRGGCNIVSWVQYQKRLERNSWVQYQESLEGN